MKIAKLFRKGMPSYVAQRFVTYWPARKTAISLIAATKPSAKSLLNNNQQDAIRDLETEGIHFLPGYFSKEQVESVKTQLAGHKVHERYAPYRKNLDLNNMPEHVHVAAYATEAVLQCKELVAAANDPKLLSIAAAYLGCKPTISNISVWWSIPDDGSAQEAENYHRDVDDWKFVKFFMYLTDVDDGTGPHRFVKKSHRSTHFSKIRRLQDDEVAAKFPKEDHLSISGKAGDAFLEDTFGIHKGQPPLRGRRLLFQVEYSINPIAVYNYAPVRMPKGGFDPYVNRLYLDQVSA